MTDTDRMVAWLREAMDAAQRDAEAASGGTVTGEPGAWVPSPAGDEWEAHRSEAGDEELLVALRPGLPRPPDVMSGMWGAVVSNVPDATDPDAWSPMPQFAHAARHDPAAVLRRIAADRKMLGECRKVLAVDGWEYDDAPNLADAVIRNLAEGWGWAGEAT